MHEPVGRTVAEPFLLVLSAVASGLAVVAVTALGDRLGGTAGGMLATAPVTTTAAFLFLAATQDTAELAARVPAGGASLFAAVLAMPAYFYAVKWTRPWPLWPRILLGLLFYVAIFTSMTSLLNALTPQPYQAAWFLAVVGLVALYAVTFLRVRIDPKHLRGPKPALTRVEALARFLAGAVVIGVVQAAAGFDPVLGAAWAVFPGVFLVTLGILGFGHGAAFSARAAQGGVLGGIPLMLYLAVLWLLLPVSTGFAWALAAMVPAWGAYFAALWPLLRWRQAAR